MTLLSVYKIDWIELLVRVIAKTVTLTKHEDNTKLHDTNKTEIYRVNVVKCYIIPLPQLSYIYWLIHFNNSFWRKLSKSYVLLLWKTITILNCEWKHILLLWSRLLKCEAFLFFFLISSSSKTEDVQVWENFKASLCIREAKMFTWKSSTTMTVANLKLYERYNVI